MSKFNINAMARSFIVLFLGLSAFVGILNHTLNAESDNAASKFIDFEMTGRDWLYFLNDKGEVYTNDKPNSISLETLQPMKDSNGLKFTNVESISVTSGNTDSSRQHGIAIRNDNSFYFWGDNSQGQAGNGDEKTRNVPTSKAILVKPNINGGKIVAGHVTPNNTYLIMENGDVYATGNNNYKQLTGAFTEDKTSTSTFIKTNLTNVKDIVHFGRGTLYALKKDGTLVGWGEKVFDGDGEICTNVLNPIPIYDGTKTKTILNNIVAIDDTATLETSEREIGGISIAQKVNTDINVYILGYQNHGYNLNNNLMTLKFTKPDVKNLVSTVYSYHPTWPAAIVADKRYYQANGNSFKQYIQSDVKENTNIKKAKTFHEKTVLLSEEGDIYIDGKLLGVVDVEGIKINLNDSFYESGEKYNDDVKLKVKSLIASIPTISYQLNKGNTNTVPNNGEIIINAIEGQPIYNRYLFYLAEKSNYPAKEYIVDLYKKQIEIEGLSKEGTIISQGEGINLGDNGFAKAGGKTSNIVTGVLIGPDSDQIKSDYGSNSPINKIGKYTLDVKDEHGNTGTFTFIVEEKKQPIPPVNPDQGGGGGEENKPTPPQPPMPDQGGNGEIKPPKPNKDHCVAGPDGELGTADDVCGNGNGKEEPTKDEEGNIHVPPGGSVSFPDKELPTPDGAIIHPDGSVTLPDGSEYDPEGNLKPKPPKPDQGGNEEIKPPKPNNPNCVVGPDGKPGTADDVCGTGSGNATPQPQEDGSIVIPPKGDGGAILPGGTVVPLPDGGTIHPDGTITIPNGSNKPDRNDCVAGPDGILGTADDVCGIGTPDKKPNKKPDGSIEVPPGGAIVFPDKIIQVPDGAIIHPDGSVTLPDGSELDANGNKKPSKQNHNLNDTTLSGGSNTGDSTNWLWWVVLIVLSSGVFVGNMIRKK